MNAEKVVFYCGIVMAVVLVIAILISIGTSLGLLPQKPDQIGSMESYTFSEEISNLDAEIGAAEFQIVTGSEFKVETNLKRFTAEVQGDTLKLKQKSYNGFHKVSKAVVTITVPEGFAFEKADIRTGAGTVSIDTLSAQELYLELGAGKVEIGTLNALEKAEIETGTGETVIFGGRLNNLELDHGVGRLELCSVLTGKASLDLGVGEATIKLVGSADDYTITMNKGLGSATLENSAMTDGSTHGNGKNHVDINGGIGSILVRFVK